MQYAVYSMQDPYGRRASAIGRVILSVVLVVTTVWLGDVYANIHAVGGWVYQWNLRLLEVVVFVRNR